MKATGFNAERRSGVTIQLGQQAKIDFSLTVGGVRQTVDVTAAPPLLQTENASLGNVVGPDRIENLPLNGRKFNDLAILTPGVQVSIPNLHFRPARTALKFRRKWRASDRGAKSTWMESRW